MCLFVLGLVTAIIVVPYQYGTKAQAGKSNGLIQKTVSHEEAYPNFDIREQGGDRIEDIIVGYRQASGKDASSVANVRDEFVRGENALKNQIPTLKVDYNTDIRIPEVIGTDVARGRAFLTAATRPAGRKHAGVLINFLKQNNSLVGSTDQQIDALKIFADYTNPDGNLSWVELEQYIHGIPVFRGGVKAGFTRQGELIRVINNLAPGLDYERVSTEFGDPADAVRFAAPLANYTLKNNDALPNESASTNKVVRFGAGGDWDITAEKIYFPTEPGVAVPAWRVLIWKPVNAYYVIVDAQNGTMLWRKNITADQTQSSTYNVYANTTSMVGTLDSPQPNTPGPLAPNLGTQGTFQNRTNVTLIGNEGNLSFNNLGWMNDNVNGGSGWTDGNAVQAGLDIDGSNGVDAPVAGTSRVFSFDFNPPPGNPAPGDPPTNAALRNGAVTHLFYINNRYHDALYMLGFTELARNFQNDNFGRGGLAFDRVSAEAQDSGGTNNANFSTPADGGRGRMQMYVFTNTPVNRDGDLDGDVIIHEHTHGLSNRLIGNGSGLGANRSGGMGEGWSDFFGSCLLSEPTDPINGIYTTGAYDTFNVFGLGTTNGYYGIRRLPYAPIGFRGGPQNRPFNPLTAADVNTGCNVSDGAFPPVGGNACNQVHNTGEIWASMLFEVRAQLIRRLGHAAGNRKMLQFVVDGMKLSPLNPNFQQERDALLAAAQASSLAPEAAVDVADVWTGFALRGMGNGATDNGTTVTESFVAPGAVSIDPFSVSDSTGDNDGFPEPGESLLLSVAVNNSTAAAIEDVMVNVSGGSPVNYGFIGPGQTVTNNVPYTVPAGEACGSLHSVFVNVVNPTGTNTTQRNFRLGVPSVAPQTFSNSAAITIPNGAPATTNGPASPYPSGITVAGLTGNKIVKVRFNGLTHTSANNLDVLLVGPGGQKMEILSDQGGANAINNVNLTLADAPVSGVGAMIVTGEFKPTADAGQDAFVSPAPPPTYLLPAPGGTATLASAYGTNGAAMNGTWNLFIVDDTATNVGSVDGGWSLIFESADFNCSLGGPSPTPTFTPTATSTNTPTPTATQPPGSPTPTGTGTPPVTVSLANVSGAPGSVVIVPITVGDTTGRGVISYDFNIDYNSAVVQPASPAFDATGTLSSAMAITPNVNNAGHFIISAFQATELSGSGTLLNLRFTIVGSGGQSSALTFADYTDPGMGFHPAFQWNEGDPPAATTNGSIGVTGGTPTGSPSGSPTNTATPVASPSPGVVSVSLPNINASQGSLITVPVTVSSLTGLAVISYDLNVDYDPAVLQPAGGLACTGNACFDAAGTLSSSMLITANTGNAGHFILSAFQATELSGSGTLVNLKFNVVSANGTSSSLVFVDYTDPNQGFHPGFQFNEGVPPAATVNGSVAVGGATPTATNTPTAPLIQFSSPTYVDDESQVAGITITRTGDTSGTNSVTFTATNGTATGGLACTAGVDFIAGTQTVTFNPGDLTRTANVTLCSDGIIEPDQTVLLSITGANVGTPSTAVLTINDTATSFRNPVSIAINQGSIADPYPSTITVFGGPNIIGSMRVTLYDVSVNIPDSVAYLLVSPSGRQFILMANAGGLSPAGPATLNFTDTAGQVVPDNSPFVTGDYEPTSWGPVGTFPLPAPAGPYNFPGSTVGGTGTQTLGGNFIGSNSNGNWNLFIYDVGTEAPVGIGTVAGGWGIEFLGSTAAQASISGRVTTAEGNGLRNARVVITGNSLAEPRVVTTGSFGYFSFDGLATGETYVVTVNSQRYTFTTPSRVISLVDNVVDADFIADPQE